MNYREALAWLFGVQRFGIKLGLENACRLFTALRVAELDARVVHIAGTNGKGSTCAMAAAICQAQGYRTGLFTSPHLITFRERIRVNGEKISEHEVALGLSAIRELVSSWEPHPTFFEIATALALLQFQQQRCDIVVLETGMGGRLDATNAFAPAVCAITPIDFDHQAWLGSTLEQIATEKAGIIKPRVPVVSARQQPPAADVIRRRAEECEAPLRFVVAPLIGYELSLAGDYQRQNAAVAVATLRDGRIEISDHAIAKGLASVEWPARFQRVGADMVVDGAHNPAGARVLAETWRAEFGSERATVIAGILRDKEVGAFWRAIAPIASRVLLPRFRSERAFAPDELESAIRKIAPELDMKICGNIAAALDAARTFSDPVLITGSLHFAGEALALLHGKITVFEKCAQ